MSRPPLLPQIHSPHDLRKLPREQVKQVTEELRQEIILRVSHPDVGRLHLQYRTRRHHRLGHCRLPGQPRRTRRRA